MRRHHRDSLWLTVIAVASIAAAPGSLSEPRAPVHLTLNDILRCNPASEPEPGRLERVGLRISAFERERGGVRSQPASIYDPGDCARSDQDLAGGELDPASHRSV